MTPYKGLAVVVEQPTATRNLFGPLEEIAGRPLFVLDRNEEGDCLCLFTGSQGQNLVSVQACDVASFTAFPPPDPTALIREFFKSL
jgi:hypothetical protein